MNKWQYMQDITFPSGTPNGPQQLKIFIDNYDIMVMSEI